MIKTRRSAFAAMVAGAVLASSAALADPPKPPPGSALAGKGIATIKCTGCHAVEKGATVSPNIKAPPFAVVAESKLSSVREVDAWLQHAHPDMPDLGLNAGQRGDVIAYLQSLNPKEPMQ